MKKESVGSPQTNSTAVTRRFNICGINLVIDDAAGSKAAEWIANELEHDEYNVRIIDFAVGDIVVDIGAHVGIFSIYIAKRNPGVTVIAFEPDPVNFQNFQHNVTRNGVDNIVLNNLAVTNDGRDFPISSPLINTGNAGAFHEQTEGHRHAIAKSTTLNNVFEMHSIRYCKLLKMDCEGAEYEIIPYTSILNRIQWFSAEFHINEMLRARGCSIEQLVAHVKKYLPLEQISIKVMNWSSP